MPDDASALMGHSPDQLARMDAGRVWHPFTHMRDYRPTIIVRGDGARVQDAEGNWYYDGTSSIWLNLHGHHVPRIDEAVRSQLDHIAHSTLLGMGNAPSAVFAERLAAVAPDGLERVFYTDNGAGAVEAAIKIAAQFWSNQGLSRPFVLGFTGNYHGDTLGSVGVAPDEMFHKAVMDLLPSHPRVAYPAPFRTGMTEEECLASSLEQTEQTLASRREIGAVIVEPVQGAGGIIVPPRGFLSGLRAICDRHDVLLIVDEVATGFGRTGTLWACDQEGVSPDIMCLGKAITGGYLPLAATLVTDRVYSEFLGAPGDGRTFFHGHSYTGNPLGCAAGLASLDLLMPLLPELPERAAALASRLQPLLASPDVGDLRVSGFMVGVELVADRGTLEPFPYEAQAGWIVASAARDLGLLVRPIGNVLVFMPAPAVEPSEQTRMADLLVEAFNAASPKLSEIAGATR